MDDPIEQWQDGLMASLDRALQRSAGADPLLYARLRNLRERLNANLTAPKGLAATGAETAKAKQP